MSLIDPLEDFTFDNIRKDNHETKNNAVIENNSDRIMELCETKFESGDTVPAFHEKLKHLVCTNLKRKGFRYGNEVLLEDEILSPTFEEVIILWCLDKVQPNLSAKIKPAFYSQLNNGQSIIELRNDIFQYLKVELQNDNINENDNGQDVTKKDPELADSIYDPMTLIKEEDIEIQCNAFNIKGENYDNTKLDLDEDLDNYSEDSDPDTTDNEYPDSDNNAQIKDTVISDNEQTENSKPNSKRSRNETYNKYNITMKCEICDRICEGEKRLKEHTEKRHNRIFSCKECDKSFRGLESLKVHKKDYHIDQSKQIKSARVFCDTCGKSLACKRKLQEHIEKKHNRTFSCKDCDASFNNNIEMRAHKLKVHKPVLKNEMCPHCGKIIRSYGMKRHILTHISDITCKICHEKFLIQDELDEHTKRHEEDPSYRVLKKRNIQCETCKRAFADAEEYGLHICKHYGCDICEERFMTKKNLEVHKKFHADEQIFSCDMCEALFTKRKALYCHKRAAHDPDKKKYKCDVCGKAFLNPCRLESHKSTHLSDRPFKCDVCHKGFKQKYGLKNHMQIHTGELSFPCVSCDFRFRTSIQMKQHRESGKCGLKSEQNLQTKVES